MLNFKKIVSTFCAMAIVATSAVSAMAAVKDSYTFSLTSGVNDYSSGKAYITLSCDGFDGTDAYTPAGQMTYKVTPKGALKSVASEEFDADGLYSPEDANEYYTDMNADLIIRLNKNVSDEYDQLSIMWGGDCTKYLTKTGNLVGVKLTYNDASNPVDLTFTPKTDNLSEQFYASAADSEGVVVSKAVTLSDGTYNTSYKLTAGTSTVAPIVPGPTEVIPTAKTTGEQIGVKIGTSYIGGDNDEDTDDVAAALGVGVMGDGNVYDELKWTVTATVDGADVTKTHVSTVDVDGTASYKFGLVIQGLAQSAITAVKAVLQ